MTLNLVPGQRKKSLAACTVDLELLCREADDKDGCLTDLEINRLDEAKLAHSERVDNWITYLDACKHLVEALEERRARAQKALKTAKNVHERLKGYIKYLLEAYPSLPWKGDDGAFYLQKNPKRLWLQHGGGEGEEGGGVLAIKSQTVYDVVPSELLELEPSMRPYVRGATYLVLDKAKLKADLEAGMTFPWARFEQGSHVRVR